MKNFLITLIAGLSLAACAQQTEMKEMAVEEPTKDLSELSTAYFASGCFWCVEAIFESVEGVEEAVSGYSGGTKPNPTYAEISSGKTKHAEAVQVFYDPEVVSYETLVDVFFNSHDPTTKNQQGPDRGPQYRSIAFYQNDTEKDIIKEKVKTLLSDGTFSTITTQVVEFEKFWEAEEYHQNYERRHPENRYVQGVSIPRLNAFKRKMPEVLKQGH